MFELILIVTFAVIFGFTNGIQGSANVASTLVFSRAMHPRYALWLAAIFEGIGPLVFGVAVANTIGQDFIDVDKIAGITIIMGLAGAIFWNVLTILSGIPSSASHALIGGLVGATIADSGAGAIQSTGFLLIVVTLVVSPLLGLLFGVLLTKFTYFLAYKSKPSINRFFKRGQIATSIFLALVFGSNDAQKTMGVITLGLVVTDFQQTFFVPTWVMVISSLTLSLGTLVGGRQLIKTLGARFYKVRPVHGFASQTSAFSVILFAGLLGGPVSTTHVVSSSIIGAGSADRLTKVRWHLFDRIGWSWVITIPASAMCGGLFFWVVRIITYV